MSETENPIDTLQLFNEKVRELRELSFVKTIIDPGAGYSLGGKRHEHGAVKMESTISGPLVEAVRTFVQVFRFFIPEDETASLSNLAVLYESIGIAPDQRERFLSRRGALNAMLDRPNFLSLNYDDATPTNRRVLEVFVYGGLAHADPEKYQTYRDWMSFAPAAVMLQTCFNRILVELLQALDGIREVNEATLQQLSRPET